MTKGLPASGKSTWAKEFVQGNKGWIRINNDDLGVMLYGEVFAEGKSTEIDRIRKAMIEAHVAEGKLNIIVDNTNLHPKHEEYLSKLIEDHNTQVTAAQSKNSLYEFEVKDFTSVSVHECIRRNKLRDKKVPDKVIYSMYRQYLQKEQGTQQDEALPKALIVDLDGNVADCNHRNPYDASRCFDDHPVKPVVELVKRFAVDHKIFFVSGRDAKSYEVTTKWLIEKAGFDPKTFVLYLKPDKGPDTAFKSDIYDKHIKGKYYVSFVLEDRSKMVELYRHHLNLPCLQTNDGDF